MKNGATKMSCVLILSSIAVLPGCDWFKSTSVSSSNTPTAQARVKDGDVVLASIDGKPLMTASEFEKQYKSFIEKHPYGAMFAQMEGIDRKIFDGLVAQKLMSYWVQQNGIDKTDEYKEQMDQVVQFLNARFFQTKHMPTVSESEMKEFYNQNKETMPEAIVSRGGVSATGVSFNSEADAKAFLDKAKGKGAQLEKIAKDAGLGDKFKDFKIVNASSIGIDQGLRDKIVALKKTPSLEIIKGSDNTYWVVYVGNKEEAKYRSFDELKGALEQRLMAKKQEEAMEKAVDQLKKDYKVVIAEDYFTKKAQNNAEPREIENDEQLEMVMPEAPAPTQQQPPSTPARSA